MPLNESDLIRKIQFGSPEEKDSAAETICKNRMRSATTSLMKLLQSSDPVIKGISIIVLGVLGVKRELLEMIRRSDDNPDVRAAAEIMLKHFGTITYKDAKNEINAARHGYEAEPEEGKKEVVELKEIVKQEERVEDTEIEKKDRKKILFPAAAALTIILLIILVVIFSSGESPEISIQEQRETFADEINNRIEEITNFKKNFVSYSDQEIFPNTIRVKSYVGDSYGSIFNEIYDAQEISVTGRNTIFSFFRKYNFRDLEKEKEPDLFDMDTHLEYLIFPNISALHLKFDLREGSVAYQTIIKPDDNLEITAEIEEVIVK